MPPPSTYAGFGRRLVAGLLDLAVIAAVTLSVGWVASHSKLSALVLLPPLWVAGMLYEPVLHAKFGATLGKFATGIRVVRVSGGSIGWQRSVIRSSVALAASASWIYIVAPLAFALPPEDFHGQGWTEVFQIIKGDFDAGYKIVELVLGIWFLSEFATMLMNSKNRAIHDFLADTVVVNVKRSDA